MLFLNIVYGGYSLLLSLFLTVDFIAVVTYPDLISVVRYPDFISVVRYPP
jgi:hypothetical protein